MLEERITLRADSWDARLDDQRQVHTDGMISIIDRMAIGASPYMRVCSLGAQNGECRYGFITLGVSGISAM